MGNARVAGMSDDLDLSDMDFGLAVNMFQISYILFSPLSNSVLPRVRPTYYITVIMFSWGVIAACMGAMQTRGQLYALRFLLGLFEAGFSPAVLFIFSMWYTRREASKRFMVFWSAAILSGAFAGLLAGAISDGLDGVHGLPGWRWLFIVEGVVTVGFSFAVPFMLIDYPASCHKFTAPEKLLAIERLEADGVDVGGEDGHLEISPWRALWSAFTTPQLWLIYIAFMTVDGSFNFNTFYPVLIAALGYESSTANYMTAPLYVVVLPVAVALSWIADRHPARRTYYLAGMMLFGALFAAITAGVHVALPRYVLMCFLNMGLYSTVPLALSFATTAMGTVQPEVRSVALGIMTGYGHVCQVATTYLWPDADQPWYTKGFATHAGILGFGAALYLLTHLWIARFPLKARL